MTLNIAAQNAIDHKIFDSKGEEASLTDILRAANSAEVLFLGELHDDSVAHRLQFQLFREIYEKFGKEKTIALSLEMFERDVQIVIDEYLRGLISEQHFLASSRPWGNYKTDYRPLIEFAKEKELPVIAANAPRRYVNMVARKGMDSVKDLSPEAKKWIAPLPIAEPSEAYARKFNNLMRGMSDSSAPDRHSPMLASQNLWDATMAYSIAEKMQKKENPLIVHLNGSFHSENRLGTVEHLLKYRPKTKILVITMRYEEDFTKFDPVKHKGLSDFIILTDAKQPRSSK